MKTPARQKYNFQWLFIASYYKQLSADIILYEPDIIQWILIGFEAIMKKKIPYLACPALERVKNPSTSDIKMLQTKKLKYLRNQK